jgi:tetratricopeptide (TPR) repeat protein
MLACQLIAIVVLAVFATTLRADFVGWDDWPVLVENPHFRGLGPSQLRWMFTSYHAGHYQPLTWLTYAVDYTVWGMDPMGFHLTNNLWHALNAVLVFLLCRSLLRRVPAIDASAAWWTVEAVSAAAALLFALHPLRVESVAWATERRDLVSAALVLLTTLAYLRSTVAGARRPRWLAISIGLYLLSMLAKIGGAPLPVVLLVLDWYPLRRLPGSPLRWMARPARRVLLEKLPMVAIAVGFSLVTIVVQSDTWAVPWDRHGPLARAAQAAWGLAFYPWKTVWPADLLPLYELHLPLHPWQPRFVFAAAAGTAAMVLALALRRRCPGLLAACLCYGAMIGPLLGFFQNGPQLVADRYSYLSCIPWVVLAAGAAGTVIIGAGRMAAVPIAAATLVALGGLSLATWRQCAVWRDNEAFWANMIERDPGSSIAQNGWGWILLDNGRANQAVGHFERALEINPANRNAWLNLWRTLEGLGRLAALRRSCEAGTASTLLSVRAAAHHRLGRLAMDEREPARALDHLQSAIGLNPDLTEARLDLARLLVGLDRHDEAVTQIDAVLRLDPGNTDARRLRRALSGGE